MDGSLPPKGGSHPSEIGVASGFSRKISSTMDQLRHDLSYAARMAARNPGFTAAAIVTLALGIGAATVTFSVVDAIVFRPLPYADVDRLVKIWGSTAAEPVDNMS